jgi:hypothetical protein
MDASPLDRTMTAYDVREVHEVVVHAAPDAVWTALHEVTLREVPAFRRLMTLREVPALLVGRRWLTSDLDRPILAQMTASGFLLVTERPPTEIVLGLAARPWRPTGVGGGPNDPESFLALDEAGWAKALLAFRLEGSDERTVLLSETRVLATDPSARRRLRLYWLAIGWASALTRKAWLSAVKRRAEHRASRRSDPRHDRTRATFDDRRHPRRRARRSPR